jgi:hypothetical protein
VWKDLLKITLRVILICVLIGVALIILVVAICSAMY